MPAAASSSAPAKDRAIDMELDRVTTNPVPLVARDVIAELRAGGPFPPGARNLDLARTLQFTHDPLPILLDAYERFGPVFALRLLHQTQVFMLGPAANQHVLVAHPEQFEYRHSNFYQLAWLLGDSLLTTDGAYHALSRAILMPAFHKRHLAGTVEVMLDELSRSTASWRPGEVVDVYDWMRRLAMRIAMRALLGLDPDDRSKGAAASDAFERGLSFYGINAFSRLLRGPRTPFAKLQAGRRDLDAIIFAEIARRRGEPGHGGGDALSMLIEARDEDGRALGDQQIRDHVTTLMFAGHDTSTSTLSFLMYELARHPHVTAGLVEEQQRVLGGGAPSFDQLHAELPALEMAVDETLRLYPPAWIAPRKTLTGVDFAGSHTPPGVYVNLSSWASHRLPDVFPDPEAFIPERFAREEKVRLPRGAYIPFGGGTRICIGKRFGQTLVKVTAISLLQRFRLELTPGRTMRISQMPTLKPRDGLPMVVRERLAT